MAKYWASPTGNDSNDGSTEALAKTFDGAWTAANAQGDEIICADGTYVLTANKTPTTSITVIAKNRRAAIFTGNFSFSGASAVKMIYSGLLFKNASGTNGVSGSHITGNSGALSAFEDCGWDMSSYTNAACFSHIITTSSFYNCDFANAVFVDGSSSQGYVYNNCTFKNISNYVINGTGKMAEFFACVFYKVSKCHNAPIATTPVQDFTSFKHCTFDLTDGNGTGTPGDIWYNTTASGTQTVYARFFNNIVYNVVNRVGSACQNFVCSRVNGNWNV